LALLTLTCQTITAPTQSNAPKTGQGDGNDPGGQSSIPTPQLAQPGVVGGDQLSVGTAITTQNMQFPTPPPTARIAFVATGFSIPGGDFEIFVMNPDGTGITNISTSLGNDRDPAWSPDGRHIAFASERDGNFEIYIMNADGSNQTRLTTSPEKDLDPAWSPDGKKIAFSTVNEDNSDDLNVINADGSGLIRLTDTPKINERYPDWSPDGQSLILSKFGGGNAGIYTMNTDGSNVHLLLGGPLHNPEWSPDGKYIVFDGEPSDCKFEVYIMKADGTGMVRITEHPEGCGGSNSHPSWSPDGKQIVFWSDREFDSELNQNEENIFVIDIDGSDETFLTHGVTKLNYGGFDPDWSRVP
jgi:TolB protein